MKVISMPREQRVNHVRKESGRFQSLRLPLKLAAGCGIAAFIVTSIMPKQYRSETTLYFPGSGDSSAVSLLGALGAGGSTGDKGNIPLIGGIVSSPQVANGPNTAITVLASDRCRKRVAESLGLGARWHQPWRTVKARLESAVTFSVNKYGLLQIEAADSDKELSQQIAQAYIDTLQTVAKDLSSSVSRRNRIFIEARVNLTRDQLRAEQDQLVSLQKRTTHALPPRAASEKLAAAYAELESQRNQTETDLGSVEARIRWQTEAANITVHHSMDLTSESPLAQASRDQLSKMERVFAVDEATLGPDNPDYRMHKIQLDEARAQVSREVSRQLSAVQSGIAPEVVQLFADRAGLTARRTGLDQAMRKMQEKLGSLPVAQMDEQRLTEEIKIEQGLVAMLEAEAERARIAEARDAPTFEVVDAPEVPDIPFAPRRIFISAFAILAGFLLGVGIQVAQTTRKLTPITDGVHFDSGRDDPAGVG